MLYWLGSAYQGQKQFDKARRAYLQAETLAPERGEPHLGMGSLASEQGDDELAVREYRQALKIDPKLVGVNYYLGLSLTKLKRVDEAISAFKNEEEVSGESADTFNALADVYAAKGMQKEADEARRDAEKSGTKKDADQTPQ